MPDVAGLDRRRGKAQMLRRQSIVLALAVSWTVIAVITVLAQEPGDAPQPSAQHKKLGVFVGTWNDEAEIKPGSLGPGGRMSLTETCDWFTGGFSVVCHTATLARRGVLKTLTVLTYDPEEKVYRFYEFNSMGWSNSAKGTVDGDTWTFDGESKTGGKLVRTRSTIKLSSPDSATMKSEMSVDGGPWTLVMELKGAREKQNLSDFNSCVPHGSEGWPFELFDCYRRLSSSH
jgi:Protein of unknown function (DUF1579)